MGGYRARGALATLALATVVLVAVILAGTVSMAPIDDPGSPQVNSTRRNDPFAVVVPRDLPTTAPSEPGVPGPGDDGYSTSDSVVVIGTGGTTGDGTGGGLIEVLPPTPIPPALPTEPVDSIDPEQPGDPTDPGPVTGEPPSGDPDPSGPQPPFEPEPTETPEPPSVQPPPRPDQPGTGPGVRPPKPPRTVVGKPTRPRVDKPPIVIVKGTQPADRGPRWRPRPPAQQQHPTKSDKWSRVGESKQLPARIKPPNARSDGKARSQGRDHRAGGHRDHGRGHRSARAKHGHRG